MVFELVISSVVVLVELPSTQGLVSDVVVVVVVLVEVPCTQGLVSDLVMLVLVVVAMLVEVPST